jgi:hypothetical protein
LVASDFVEYLDIHTRIENDYKNKDEWFRRSFLTAVRYLF